MRPGSRGRLGQLARLASRRTRALAAAPRRCAHRRGGRGHLVHNDRVSRLPKEGDGRGMGGVFRGGPSVGKGRGVEGSRRERVCTALATTSCLLPLPAVHTKHGSLPQQCREPRQAEHHEKVVGGEGQRGLPPGAQAACRKRRRVSTVAAGHKQDAPVEALNTALCRARRNEHSVCERERERARARARARDGEKICPKRRITGGGTGARVSP